MYIPRIVITSGDPAGVGPDACVSLAQRDWEADLVIGCDAIVTASDECGSRMQPGHTRVVGNSAEL